MSLNLVFDRMDRPSHTSANRVIPKLRPMTSLAQLPAPAALVDGALIVERLRSAGRLDRAFIDGDWVVPHGQARSSVIDPSTEEPVAEIALGDASDVAVAVA